VTLREIAAVPMKSEAALRMVEIVVLKWRCEDIEALCADRIIRNTRWPFKLVVYDNRPNTPNTARIWNKLIRESTCEYVCLIDSDAFVPDCNPCWLTRLIKTFDQPDCRIVLPVTNRCSSPQQRAEGPSEYPDFVRDDSVWSGFCFLLRRSLLDEVGAFDEEFVGYGQDSEFAVRLARNGGGAYLRRDVWVEHLHGASFQAATSQGGHDAAADRLYAQEVYLRKIAG